MNYEIGSPEMAWLLLAAPCVAMLFLYARWANRRARQRFGAANQPSRWLTGLLSASLLTLGFALLALACMDIRWGKTTREVPQKGLEVVFALDVSRSMLAEDAKPNRLTRAKQQIKDMLAEMAGDRVGLVVFAGEANQAVPLTSHYHDFHEKLDSVGPESVSVGGSQLGIAIKAASEAFLSKTNDHKTMVLFTDGEDQESQPIELAKQLHAENGLRIFTVGLGDITEGARIPNQTVSRRSRAGEFVQHQGQQVWSKLNGSILKKIATESNAAYIPAGTKRVNMADVYHRYIANVEKSEFETAKINAFIPRYQWLAFPALVCIFLHTLIGTRTQKPSSINTRSKTNIATNRAVRSAVGKAAAIILLLPGVAFCQTADNESVATRINAANEMLRQQNVSEAIKAYNAIGETASDEQVELQYNLASAHYRNSDIEAAEALFAITAKSDDNRIARDSLYNLGNCHYAKALALVEQQPDAATVELGLAIKQYQNALRSDRSFSEARENLERAKKLIEKLKEEKKEEQEDQNREQQSQQKDDKPQDDSKSEQSSDQKNSESEDSEQQDSEKSDEQQIDSQSNSSQDQQQGDSSASEEQSNQQPQGNENADQQESDQQSGQSQSEPNSQDSSEQSSSEQASQSPDQPNDQQEPNADASAETDDGKGPPDGELAAANESESEEQAEDGQPKAALARQSDEGKDNQTMTQQEALKLLQAVRDRDMLRRFQKKQRQRQNRVRVEKDW